MPAKSQPPSSFELIEDTWFTLRDNFDDALRLAQNKADRNSLLHDRDGARDAYNMALSKTFDEQDEFIKKTKKELKEVTAEMKRELAKLQNIAAVLNAISSAVKLAAALAAMAIP